jgi:formyltetrahydrofolate deformylase
MANDQALVELTVIGKDRKGVVADITNFIFTNGGNIENVNQKVTRGLFGMHLEASFQKIDRLNLDSGLMALSRKLDMEIKVH